MREIQRSQRSRKRSGVGVESGKRVVPPLNPPFLSSSSPPHHTLPQLLPDSQDLYRCYLLRGLSEAGAGGSINILRRWEREGGIRCRQTKDQIFSLSGKVGVTRLHLLVNFYQPPGFSEPHIWGFGGDRED